MYCNQCGTNIPDNSKFCSNCGNPVRQQTEQSVNQGVYFTPPTVSQQIQQKPITHQAVVSPQIERKVKGGQVAQGGLSVLINNKPYKDFPSTQKQTAFVFVSPYDTNNTMRLLCDVITAVGKVKDKDERSGYIKGKMQIASMQSVKMDFYISQKDSGTSVRTVMHSSTYASAKDVWYDHFLDALFAYAPNVDFGITKCNGNPYMVGVRYLGSDTVLQTQSRTSGGTSLLGFLAGDALFGTAGAIVGGMSGTQHTRGTTKEAFGKRRLVRVVFNNGRIYEGEIKKNSKAYNQIMGMLE